MDMGFDAGAA